MTEIIRAAQRTGADAVYPGYGFLSENPELAAACEQAGITFVGPPPDVLELAGNKVAGGRRGTRRRACRCWRPARRRPTSTS